MAELTKPDPPTRPYLSWLVAIEGGIRKKKWCVEKNPAYWIIPHSPNKAKHYLWETRRFTAPRRTTAAVAETRGRLAEEMNKELAREDEEQEAPSSTTGGNIEGLEAEVVNRELLRNMPTWTRS